jgi:hypothetical protein
MLGCKPFRFLLMKLIFVVCTMEAARCGCRLHEHRPTSRPLSLERAILVAMRGGSGTRLHPAEGSRSRGQQESVICERGPAREDLCYSHERTITFQGSDYVDVTDAVGVSLSLMLP